MLASCGSGFGPAIQALSVELFTRRGGKETGRLFGVLSVIQITRCVLSIARNRTGPDEVCCVQFTNFRSTVVQPRVDEARCHVPSRDLFRFVWGGIRGHYLIVLCRAASRQGSQPCRPGEIYLKNILSPLSLDLRSHIVYRSTVIDYASLEVSK